ncbi:MAG: hypothetical protein IJ185_04980 [Prevotella sp.]|nr:hypothetical protein [Prevotella sp.]
MNGFNINRFGKTLRWVVSVNFRKLLLWFAGSVLAVFLGEIIFKVMNPYGNPQSMLRDFSQFLTMILILVSVIMVSSVVSSINEKRKREAFLMLPASNLEKFLSLIVYSTVICIACAFLAIVLGDALRMFAYWAVGYQGMPSADGTYCYSVTSDYYGDTFYWWSSSIPMLIDNLTPTITTYDKVPTDLMIVQTSFIIGLILLIHSTYTLGGTLLRKYSFVGTSAFMIVIDTLIIKLIMALGLTMFHSQWDNGVLQSYEIGLAGWVLTIAFPIFSVIFYWASFQIFKRFELITNKWMNYDIFKR